MAIQNPLPGAPRYDDALAARLGAALAAKGPAYVPRTHHLASARGPGGHQLPTYTNRLILESSPYLIQHAHNPVDWRPWGDEAFAEARRLGRPVFLSVGYSTCHWCHVMEGESFEDEEIAGYLNGNYVCIKVDREERPDVDAIYMSAVQAIAGQGGWPMSVWLNPDRQPFFGGTYFPPRDGARGAQHGFLTVLRQLHDTYTKDSARVAEAAASLARAVRAEMEAGGAAAGATPGPVVIANTVAHFKRSFDDVYGGVRRAPKFPSNMPVRLLLRYHRRSGDAQALRMATLTLEKMAAGGMYDQLGGGFHRYSTDSRWLVPHFEKMLYDNALLAVAYAEASQVTGRADFARVTRETLDYVLREMTSPAGAFYSATDADSEGEEGKFFVWSEAEIESVLGPGADTARFLRYYGVTPGGNFESANILNAAHPEEAEHAALAGARAKLYAVRARRVPPLRDEKILAAWNGLMISGFAVAGHVLGDPRYVEAAARAAAYLLDHMRPGGRLARSSKDGQVGAGSGAGAGAGVAGFLDDYAFLAAGLIDLYEASFDGKWLEAARALAEQTETLFADPEHGGWFMTAGDHEKLLAREKPAYDGAEPSGTSVALLNALRLATFTSDDRWRKIAERAFASIGGVLADRPIAMTEALLALDYATDVPREVAVVWPKGSGEGGRAAAAPLLAAVRKAFLPNRALAGAAEDQVPALARVAAFVEEKVAVGGKPTAYVCERGKCELPTNDPTVLAAQLAKVRAY